MSLPLRCLPWEGRCRGKEEDELAFFFEEGEKLRGTLNQNPVKET